MSELLEVLSVEAEARREALISELERIEMMHCLQFLFFKLTFVYIQITDEGCLSTAMMIMRKETGRDI